MSEKSILVMGAFKTGTHTVYATLLNNLIDSNCTIERSHINKNKLVQNNYDIIVFTFRNDDNLMPSTFFQDIITPVHYEPFGYDNKLNRPNFLAQYATYDIDKKKEIIMNTPVEKLIDFYTNVFMTYKVQPSMDECQKLYEDLYNIKINRNEKIQFFKFNNKKIIVLDINYFEENIKSFLDFIDIKYKNNPMIVKSNIGEDKWYGKKYKEFLECLKLTN
jgi:hypothetical protein